MRHLSLALAFACLALSCGNRTAAEIEHAGSPCLARPAHVDGQAITWHQGSPDDAYQLDRWCRAVGPPILAPRPSALPAGSPPALEDLVVVTWNAHLAEGRLTELVRRLQAGALTDGKPVNHFVLLIQEAYRRGAGVPEFPEGARTAFGIVPRDPYGPDVLAETAALGLSAWYVPSMRNGHTMREDRGNAIVSTEPLLDPRALELPLARQRRVVAGATIAVRTAQGAKHLHLWSAHLEPVSSPETLWLFHNPRQGQVRAILSVLAMRAVATPTPTAGVVLGGDFNTIRSGDDESAYALARQWSTSLAEEDRRRTHLMGRLDYLFFRLAEGWQARARRADERFGSDHYPVAGQFTPSR
jgi:endonuclease/exonuclease/phosphatase family metal-dependent hydrolase